MPSAPSPRNQPSRASRAVIHHNWLILTRSPGPLQSGMGVRASDTTTPERVIRCVLWHARGAVLPGALVAALDRPQVQWKAWDSEYLALAEAMRFQGDALTHDTPARVLVLVEPSRLHGVDDVLTVLERFRPRAPLWVFEGGPKPSLQGMAAAEARARIAAARVPAPNNTSAPEPPRSVAVEAKPAPQVVTRRIGLVVPRPVGPRTPPKSPPPPPLRLAGAEPEASVSVPANSPEPVASSPPSPTKDEAIPEARPAGTLLTEEEIEMLLSDRPPNGKAPERSGGNVR